MWRKFSVAEVSTIQTGDIRALIDLIEERDLGLWGYIQAMYRVWGSREPEIARAMVIEKAASIGMFSSSTNSKRHAMEDYIYDFYHQIISGIALTDPALAFHIFLEDLANPEVERIVDDNTTIPDIFASFAVSNPTEAWQAVLSSETKAHFIWKLRGYLDGVATVHDWDALTSEALAFASEQNIEIREWEWVKLAGRWYRDDAEAAMAWFTRNAPTKQFLKGSEDPFDETLLPIDHLSTSEVSRLLENELVCRLFGEEDQALIRHLGSLSSKGDYRLTRVLLDELTSSALTPQNTSYLEILPFIEDTAIREELFLKFVQSTRPRGEEDIMNNWPSFEAPNHSYEKVRELADNLDLSSGTHAKARDYFIQLENREKVNRTRLEEKE
ncbi:hypothetical protein ACFQY0_15090 [Haloferula chungangensis]|uniref:Uncharacterized protein n=1 Tax=Haloferula chungangensis TaxID=1048331 RepID=A0ABW2L7Z8_9BACT